MPFVTPCVLTAVFIEPASSTTLFSQDSLIITCTSGSFVPSALHDLSLEFLEVLADFSPFVQHGLLSIPS